MGGGGLPLISRGCILGIPLISLGSILPPPGGIGGYMSPPLIPGWGGRPIPLIAALRVSISFKAWVGSPLSLRPRRLSPGARGAEGFSGWGRLGDLSPTELAELIGLAMSPYNLSDSALRL